METTIEKRKVIINLHNHRKSLSEISPIISRPRSTLQNRIYSYGQRNRLQNNSSSGRSQKLDRYIRQVIIRMMRQN